MRTRFLSILALLLLFTAPAYSQVQMELGWGVSERDYGESHFFVGYDFPTAPLTVGLHHSCENGFRWSTWDPSHSAGLFLRAYTGKGRFRFNADIVADFTVYRKSCYYDRYTERALYIQPGFSWYFTDNLALRLNVFRFGLWGVRLGDNSTTSDFECRLNTVSVTFVLKLFY